MSAYEEHADRLAEHVPEECDDPFCQICDEMEEAEKWLYDDFYDDEEFEDDDEY